MGAVVELIFKYIWTTEATPRITQESVENPRDLVLRANWVLAMTVNNAPTPDMLATPVEQVPWGFSEVADVDVEAVEIDGAGFGKTEAIHISVRWEGPRRIDIWCRDVDLLTP